MFTISCGKVKSFLKNKLSLRHNTFKCINNKNNTVYHFKNTFNFSTKVSMAWSINDVDFCVFICDGSVFRKNCNTSFSFNIV